MPWLALETDSDVLQAAIRRPDLPEEVLRHWVSGDNYYGPENAARYAHTPDDLLLTLARSEENDVHRALLARKELPPKVILALAGNSAGQVAKLARTHPSYGPAHAARRKRRLLILGILLGLLVCAGLAVGAVSLGVGLIQLLLLRL